MLNLSEILMQHPELDSFDELFTLIQVKAKSELHFRIDVKPQYADTPDNWEDRLEAAFT